MRMRINTQLLSAFHSIPFHRSSPVHSTVPFHRSSPPNPDTQQKLGDVPIVDDTDIDRGWVDADPKKKGPFYSLALNAYNQGVEDYWGEPYTHAHNHCGKDRDVTKINDAACIQRSACYRRLENKQR